MKPSMTNEIQSNFIQKPGEGGKLAFCILLSKAGYKMAFP